MKRLLKRLLMTFAPLALVACASAPYMVETKGAFQRTTARVIERHDAYVQADESLDNAAEAEALIESAELSALVQIPSVSASILADAFEPVASRHDAYVNALELDVFVRDVYLEDSERLRSLLAEAASHEPSDE